MVFVMPDLSSAVFWAALWKIIIANIILVVNLLEDILYAVLNPRIRYA